MNDEFGLTFSHCNEHIAINAIILQKAMTNECHYQI
jgi:hypothetical protein